jgi:hypothetical protein
LYLPSASSISQPQPNKQTEGLPSTDQHSYLPFAGKVTQLQTTQLNFRHSHNSFVIMEMVPADRRTERLYPGEDQQGTSDYIGGHGLTDALLGGIGIGGQAGANTKPWMHLIDDTKPMQGTDLSVFEGRGHFYLRQEIDVAEAVAAQLGWGCVEQSNKYVLFDAQTKEPLLYIRETGVNQLERCW